MYISLYVKGHITAANPRKLNAQKIIIFENNDNESNIASTPQLQPIGKEMRHGFAHEV